MADINLSRVAAELRGAVQHLAVEDAADQLPKLSRDIDSVQLLAGALWRRRRAVAGELAGASPCNST
ncbi:hypothetical protein LNO81_25430 [Klebsiella variicola subsp. variicola]|nr:hypothetical protein [Klebsiella variicola subsp. variicola]